MFSIFVFNPLNFLLEIGIYQPGSLCEWVCYDLPGKLPPFLFMSSTIAKLYSFYENALTFIRCLVLIYFSLIVSISVNWYYLRKSEFNTIINPSLYINILGSNIFYEILWSNCFYDIKEKWQVNGRILITLK